MFEKFWGSLPGKIAASVMLLLASPAIAVTALGVLARHGWPVIIRVPRQGTDGNDFPAFVFRARTNSVIGKIIRAGKLDQMLQLAHAVTGNMEIRSIIFPRYVRRDSPVLQSLRAIATNAAGTVMTPISGAGRPTSTQRPTAHHGSASAHRAPRGSMHPHTPSDGRRPERVRRSRRMRHDPPFGL